MREQPRPIRPASAVRGLRALYLRSGLRKRLPHDLKWRLRGGWARLARRLGYPLHSPLAPPPPRPRPATRMTLTHALLACDLNPRYLEYWDLASGAWESVAGVRPVLVLVAEHDDVPAALRADDRVRVFAPVPGLHTAFQAQCVRLLYPALVETAGVVVVSDMDLFPLDGDYFHRPLAGLDASFFVSYRDVLLPRGEVAVCYNAAAPATWSDVFDVEDEDAVAAKLRAWAEGVGYAGARGGAGWFTDQLVLHDALRAWGARTGRLWLLDDQFTGHRRLERAEVERAGAVTPDLRRRILARSYSDFHSPVPHSRSWRLEDEVVELAIAAAGRRGRWDTVARRWLGTAE